MVGLANKQWLNLVILGEDNNDYAALANAIRLLNLNGKAKAQHIRNCTDLPIYIYICLWQIVGQTNCMLVLSSGA